METEKKLDVGSECPHCKTKLKIIKTINLATGKEVKRLMCAKCDKTFDKCEMD